MKTTPTPHTLNKRDLTPLLTAGEEVELGRLIEAGLLAEDLLRDPGAHPRWSTLELQLLVQHGQAAKDRMITSNLRLVWFWVRRRYSARSSGMLDQEDLFMAGVEGLAHAVEMWDYTFGLKFSTYASGWIRNRIGREATRGFALSATHHDHYQLTQLLSYEDDLRSRGETRPTAQQAAKALGTTVARVLDLRNLQHVCSLDATVGHDEKSVAALVDRVQIDPSSTEAGVAWAAVGRLPFRQRRVIDEVFGLTSGTPSTLEAAAARIGVPATAAQHVLEAALAALRADAGVRLGRAA